MQWLLRKMATEAARMLQHIAPIQQHYFPSPIT
jgi:hypothetical protein